MRRRVLRRGIQVHLVTRLDLGRRSPLIHPSSATHVSPFELAHGFPARVPLTLDLAAHARLTGDREAADYALVVHNRHRAAADNVAAAQVRLGRLGAC